MTPFNLFDLHSDTLTELYYGKKELAENDLHVSLKKAEVYRHYAQVFAIFTSSHLSDEAGFDAFLGVSDYFRALLEKHSDRIAFASNAETLRSCWAQNKLAAFLAVEDARILAGRLERLNTLYERGVRFLTLTWAGGTVIGGSWNTKSGLTPFGKDTVRECFRLGIVPDVSHASVASTDDVLELASIAQKPIVATHSDAFSVYGHGRNLSDEHFKEIRRLGGIVGINLYKHHLCDAEKEHASCETILRHIEHDLSLGGEDTVVFGCDFDGAELPDEIHDVSSLPLVAETLLKHNYPEALVEKIFWKNADAFLSRAFRTEPKGSHSL